MRRIPIYENAFKADPFPLYEELRAEGPLTFVVVQGGVQCWLVTEYALVRDLLKDPRLSKNAELAGPAWHNVHVNRSGSTSRPIFEHLLTMDPPRHTRLRGLVSKAFQPSHVELLRPTVQRIVDETLDAVPADHPIDFVSSFATTVPLVVICELLGVPLSDRARFRRWTEVLMSASAEEQALIPGVGAQMRAYLLELADTMPTGLENSLYARLVDLRRRGELNDEELAAMGFLLLVAGHETTAALLSSGLLALKTTAGAWSRLTEAPDETDCVVEELLRYCSPIEVATPRFARQRIEVGGRTILSGDTVFLSIAAANRDASRFTCPHTLNIERDARGHLAFGLGPHFCLGASLARLEASLAFSTLAKRYPNIEVLNDERALAWAPGLLLRGLRSLTVRLEPDR